MKCADFERLSSRYVDGDLGLLSQRLVEHHLRRCPQCAVVLDDMRALNSRLASLGVLDETAAEERAAVDRILRALPGLPPPPRARRPVPLLAVAAVVGAQLVTVTSPWWTGFFRKHRPFVPAVAGVVALGPVKVR